MKTDSQHHMGRYPALVKEQRMKLISWNVNGIRACLTKGFEESFKKLDGDVFVCRKPSVGRTSENRTSGLSSVLELCQS